ncbi:MAG: V-type ATP synthase subunit A, partial [Mucinivorans sp.]
YMFDLVMDIAQRELNFTDFEACITFYKSLINSLRQMNYSVFEGDDFKKYKKQAEDILASMAN